MMDCLHNALQALFPGLIATASVGDPIGEVGGHMNFNVQLQFASRALMMSFYAVYSASARAGFGPMARFGPGPALHLENLNWNSPSGDGSYSGNATAHIDLYNPNNGDLAGIGGHIGIDGLVGHIVQAVGSNIDPANCPW